VAKRIVVEVQHDFLHKIANAHRPLRAVEELAWNSLDADATLVEISFDRSPIDGVAAIRIKDNGTGITPERAAASFEKLGNSWKKGRESDGGRHLHGKIGQGRFSAFALGAYVRWTSRFQVGNAVNTFDITGTQQHIKDFEMTEPAPVTGTETGTEVHITEIAESLKSLLGEEAPQKLAERFAAYARKYPIRIIYDGRELDLAGFQEDTRDYDVVATGPTGKHLTAQLAVIEWKTKVNRDIYLCDSAGFPLVAVPANVTTKKGFNFNAYLRSDSFRELLPAEDLEVAEMHPDIAALLAQARIVVRDHFRNRSAEDARDLVKQWKESDVYPYVGQPKDEVERVERQVFDVLALNVNEYLPSFRDLNEKTKRFSFVMMKTALENDPSTLRKIFAEVINLPQEKRAELAELLETTTLTGIIEASKLIVDRLKFVAGFEHMLFNKDMKAALLERTQLHRILVQNTWLFGEQFSLTVDDQGLTEVLRQHLKLLGKDRKELAPVKTAKGTPGILDAMLSRRVPRNDPAELEHLVIEWKRPAVKIDEKIVGQLKKYAFAVAMDERFKHTGTRWTMIAVSNEIDDQVEWSYFGQGKPDPGLIEHVPQSNMRLYVRTWGQLIHGCRSRLEFVQKKLGAMASKDSGVGHLRRIYAEYLPSENAAKKARARRTETARGTRPADDSSRR
jgi:hypothetical protein